MITGLTGNGRLLLTQNEDGEWNELFYPYPGLFQHLREVRLGIFDVGRSKFSWLRRGGDLSLEQRHLAGPPGNLPASRWTAPGLSLIVQDQIHPNHDLIIRTVRIRTDEPKELRLFSYHSLNIAESMYQETAYLDAGAATVVHYKRGFYFRFLSQPAYTRAVCGQHTLRGLRGTYVDAEDGMLGGGTVSHGAADSAMQWDFATTAGGEKTIRVFVALGTSPESAARLAEYVRAGDPGRFEREAEAFWRAWVVRHPPDVKDGLSPKVQELYQASALVMRHLVAENGSILASPDTRSLALGGDSYTYCWMRDGGYVSKAMDEAGLYDNAGRFLRFATRCQSRDGSFLHRFFPDGAIGSTWHPPPFLQIDQTGTVIAAIWHHFKRQGDLDLLLEFWPTVKSAANFLAWFRDASTGLPRPSYDLWEEVEATHTYSTAVVIHALERAARIAAELGKEPNRWRVASQEIHTAALEHLWDAPHERFLRRIDPRDDRLDSSVLVALKLGLLDWADSRCRAIVDQVESRLWTKGVGGLARYEGDEYYGHENPWVICTLWLAEARLNLGDRGRCRELLEWVADRATPTLMLPEQVDPASGEARSATPLTWSHATYVDVVNKYCRVASGHPVRDE